MLRSFWSKGLFDEPSKRYFQLINRAPGMEDCVHRDSLPAYDPYDSYERLFVAENVDKQSYLDRMTHFDFKTLLPALLQVEDRMSMAHGLESRVPFLDRELVESVLEEQEDARDEYELAKSAAFAKLGTPHRLDEKEYRRAAGFLTRKGFGSSEIRRALEEYQDSADEES